LGSGAAHRLSLAGFPVVIVERAEPLAVRLGASYARAVWEEQAEVDGLVAQRVEGTDAVRTCWANSLLPVIVAVQPDSIPFVGQAAIVDARMLKKGGLPLSVERSFSIGLGPGFRAGVDCDAAVETQRGHWLGRVYWQGGPRDDTGMPDPVRGHSAERVVRAPSGGRVTCIKAIGDAVHVGDVLATVDAVEVRAPIDGVVRGLIHEGVVVTQGLKIGDVDPRAVREFCFSISDKALAVGGGVLSAVLASGAFRTRLASAAAPPLPGSP
jgi:xanthine dehydrogenase accessory factor